MARAIQDERYLCVSAYVRGLETQLLTGADLDRMIDSASPEDALRVLTDHGFPVIPPNMPALEQALRQRMEQLFADLAPLLPRQELLDLFRVEYDFHNIKVALKAQWTGVDGRHLLLGGGLLDKEALYHQLHTGEDSALPEAMLQAVQQVRETVAATGDPQKGDLLLDRACQAQLLALARELDSRFLLDYVRLNTDRLNLQTAVRILRMGKGAELLENALLEGGSVEPEALSAAILAGDLTAPWLSGPLEDAALLGKAALEGKGLTAFERACDNAPTRYLQGAALIPFGPGPVLAFVAARVQEGRNVRIVLSGKLAGLPANIIRERMREVYV